MLVGFIISELVGLACGQHFLRRDHARFDPLCPRLAAVGLFLGHVWVGIVTPYAVLALLVPRPDWLAGIEAAMAASCAVFGGSALLAGFLAGLLASRAAPPAVLDDAGSLGRTLAHGRPRSTPREAA